MCPPPLTTTSPSPCPYCFVPFGLFLCAHFASPFLNNATWYTSFVFYSINLPRGIETCEHFFFCVVSKSFQSLMNTRRVSFTCFLEWTRVIDLWFFFLNSQEASRKNNNIVNVKKMILLWKLISNHDQDYNLYFSFYG